MCRVKKLRDSDVKDMDVKKLRDSDVKDMHRVNFSFLSKWY